MQKSEKGITMIVLVITIVILMILTAVSVNTGYSVLKDMKIGRTISNMVLVKAKAETIYEQYQFSREEADLVGEQVSLNETISQEEKNIIRNGRYLEVVSMEFRYFENTRFRC